MRFVVTGCARSGTGYVARLLGCGHEFVYATQGRRPRPAEGDVSCFAAPHLPIPGVTTVHLVRAPLHCIASLAGKRFLDGAHREFASHVARHAPEVFDHPPGARRAAAYWLAWNRLAARADLTWRLHTLSAVDPVNVSDPQPVDLDDLGPLAGPVAEAAEAYGVPLRV